MIFGLFGGEKKRIAELIAAARAGDTEKVKLHLSKGVDINASEPESGDTALLAAIDKGQWTTAEYLLTQRPDLIRQLQWVDDGLLQPAAGGLRGGCATLVRRPPQRRAGGCHRDV